MTASLFTLRMVSEKLSKNIPNSFGYVTFQKQVRVTFCLLEVVPMNDSRLAHADFVSAADRCVPTVGII